MKLKYLTVRNFIGIVEASLSITKRINLFIGENGHGKTSLASAPEYLATGTARGLTLKKDRNRLIHRGAGKTEVIATLDNDITLRRTTAATSETFRAIVNNKETGEFPFNWNVIGLNPFLYFEKSIEERKHMLYRLVAGESSAETITAKLIERGVPEKTASAIAVNVEKEGFGQTQTDVIESRKQLKRDRELLKNRTAPSSTITIDEQEYVLTEYTVEQLNTALATLEEGKNTLLMAKGKISNAVPKSQVQANLDQVITALTEAETKHSGLQDPNPFKSQVKVRQEAIDKLNKDLGAARATNQLMEENLNLKVPSLDFEKCPVMEGVKCPVSDKDKRKVKAVFEDRKNRAKQVTDETNETIGELTRQRDQKIREQEAQKDEIQALEDKIDRAHRAVMSLRTMKAELEKALETAVDTVGDTAKLDEEISEVSYRAEVGRKLVSSVEAYHDKQKAFESATPQIIEKDKEIKLCDLLDAALSPNGIPAELTQNAMGEFKARIAQTSKVFGVSVDVNPDDYLPLWNGQHYNLICRSEQWRARLFFQEAIAHLAKTPWLIIDEADTLDFKNRGYFFDIIFEIAKDYDFVGVFATQNDETIPVIDHELIDFWHVHEGRVDLLKTPEAQAA